jgi:hypothetical protein
MGVLQSNYDGWENPQNAVAVTASDATTFAEYSTLYIGTSGNLTVDLGGKGKNITFNNVPVGFFPCAVSKVWNTGTTASNIVRLY